MILRRPSRCPNHLRAAGWRPRWAGRTQGADRTYFSGCPDRAARGKINHSALWARRKQGQARTRSAAFERGAFFDSFIQFRTIAMQHLITPHSASILLIDDEPDMLDEVSSALAQTGYICRCCQEPKAAAMMARQFLPDLVISDINLGAASGLEICAELKQIEGLANVPVIFLSGAQIPDVVKRAHAAGGAYYLRKPFDPEVLIELVEKALWMPHLVHYAKPLSVV